MAEQADKPPPSQPPTSEQVLEAEDPDFDDLDDVLDQFSANAPSSSKPSQPPPTSSGPGRPTADIPIPTGPHENESEEEFIKRLTTEMSSVMSQMSTTADAAASPEDLAKMGKELEEFTHKMEAEGIKPEDLLKAIMGEEAGSKLGEAANDERERRESQPASTSKSPEPKPKSSSFEETIRRTIERMEDSSAKATTASQQKSEEDMLADLLRSLETNSGEGGEGDLSKMFLGMMEQLTNKDMLYEPMAELNTKFPAWLEENKSKLNPEDVARYTQQQKIVKDIVSKFEEKNYSDDDSKCREYIWEKMQKMQEQGAPPEDLIQSPMGIPGLGGGEGMAEEGCPTQ